MLCAPMSSALDGFGSRVVQTLPFLFLKDPEDNSKNILWSSLG